MFNKNQKSPIEYSHKIILLGIFVFIVIAVSGCGLATTRPKMEMELAKVAFEAAGTAKAQSLSPNLYRKAEFYYLKARSAYRRKYFNKAKEYAALSKVFSEKAEYVATRKASQENSL